MLLSQFSYFVWLYIFFFVLLFVTFFVSQLLSFTQLFLLDHFMSLRLSQ